VSFLKKILKETAKDYTFGSLADAPGNLPTGPLRGNSVYLNVFLRSMRIVNVRSGWSKFYPVVHSHISIPHLAGQVAEFQVVTSPSHLSELDSNHLDRIISLNHRLLGPIPYRGGDLNLEIGLFSVKSQDLAKPFLSVLETMALAAGVSYVSVAMPFVGPLKKGLELLTGSNDITLEIGISTSLNNPEAGTFYVMRAASGEVKTEDIKITREFRLVDKSNQNVAAYPYFVFSIEPTAVRDDWFLIPEIAATHTDLRDAVRNGQQNQIDDLFAAFRRTVLTSPDLLSADAKRLVSEVHDELVATVPTGMTSDAARDLRPLKSIPLFGTTGSSEE